MNRKFTTYADIFSLVNVLGREFCETGLKNIYFTACGGSLGGLAPMFEILNAEAKTIHASLITAGDFITATPRQVGPHALVVTMSASGNTPETVAAAKKAKTLGAKVVTLSRLPDTQLEAEGDYHILYGFRTCEYSETSTALLMRFAFELLEHFEGYAHYDDAIASFRILDEVCDKAFEDSKAPAEAFAEKYKDMEQIYVLGSGNSKMVAYTTCICHFMEMEWIHAGYSHSGEFFHGPFEVAQPEIPYMLLMNIGPTRSLDERAAAFLEKHTDNLSVVDAKDYGVLRFAPAVAHFFNTIVLAIVARQYTEALAKAKNHPFNFRRYMFKVAY